MEIKEFMPKLDLRQFLVFVIPGMIFSFTVLTLLINYRTININFSLLMPISHL